MWDFDVEEFLETTRARERQRLETELERIDRQLEEREKIHEEVISELESKLDWYTNRLEKLYKQSRGRQGRRSHIKSKIDELYQELRNSKQSVWQDKQKLEEERRQLLREMEELETTLTDLL